MGTGQPRSRELLRTLPPGCPPWSGKHQPLEAGWAVDMGQEHSQTPQWLPQLACTRQGIIAPTMGDSTRPASVQGPCPRRMVPGPI